MVIVLTILVLKLSLSTGAGANSTPPIDGYMHRSDESLRVCGRHGSLEARRCVCDGGFRLAGPTDIFAFYAGKCSQFECKSDSQCRQFTAMPEATCPVEGWNCECPWRAATGFFEGEDFSRARCMGFMYLLSSRVVSWSVFLMAHMYKIAFFAMLVLSPLGERKVLGRRKKKKGRHGPEKKKGRGRKAKRLTDATRQDDGRTE
jgi:hypothetical protein